MGKFLCREVSTIDKEIKNKITLNKTPEKSIVFEFAVFPDEVNFLEGKFMFSGNLAPKRLPIVNNENRKGAIQIDFFEP